MLHSIKAPLTSVGGVFIFALPGSALRAKKGRGESVYISRMSVLKGKRAELVL